MKVINYNLVYCIVFIQLGIHSCIPKIFNNKKILVEQFQKLKINFMMSEILSFNPNLWNNILGHINADRQTTHTKQINNVINENDNIGVCML